MTVSILRGDSLAVLKTLPSDHFHCVVTSPPYWGLRDYGVDGQIGLEPTPEGWCARLVEVFREVRRVLRPDGVCFVNIGDSYAASTKGAGGEGKQHTNSGSIFVNRRSAIPAGLKPKDLVGQPWMLAFALRTDGWWLRGDYIWAKPNPMPESVRDRCTKAHEYVFHLSKSDRYFWDADALREPHVGDPTTTRGSWRMETSEKIFTGGMCETFRNTYGRNLRSVWTIATDPLPSVIVDGEKLDHFASYPIELASRCILAGTSAKGCCPACGTPWTREVEREAVKQTGITPKQKGYLALGLASDKSTIGRTKPWGPYEGRTTTTGWRPTCSCPPAEPRPCRVLDPFGGSGRTALAAEDLRCDCTLIELNPKSCEMAKAQLARAKARRLIGDVTDRVKVPEGQLGFEW